MTQSQKILKALNTGQYDVMENFSEFIVCLSVCLFKCASAKGCAGKNARTDGQTE